MMTSERKLETLNSYKRYLESKESGRYAFVNETRVHSAKASLCTLFCVNFDNNDEYTHWTDNDLIIQFWVSNKLLFSACCNGCNAKTYKWVAIQAIEKEIEKIEGGTQ